MPLSSRLFDTVYTYRFLKILTTPWKDMKAYKLGIIDENGNILKKMSSLKTDEEKSAYTMFHRMVWKIKKMIEKMPGGKSKFATYAAGLALLKEYCEKEKVLKSIHEDLVGVYDEYFKNNIGEFENA